MLRRRDDDDGGCSGDSVLAQVVVACAPIVVTHLLDVRRDRVQATLRKHEPAAERESFRAYVARRRGAR